MNEKDKYNIELFRALDELEKLQVAFIAERKYTDAIKNEYLKNKENKNLLEEFKAQIEKHELFLKRFDEIQNKIHFLREKISKK